MQVDIGSRTQRVLGTALVFSLVSQPAVLTFGRLVPVLVPITIVLAIIVVRAGRTPMVVVPISALAFFGWVLLSAAWSIDISYTAVQTVSTALLFGAALLLALIVPFPEILRGFAIGAFASLLVSLVFAIADPVVGFTHDAYQFGALTGIYGSRNLLAEVLTIGFIAALSFSSTSSRGAVAQFTLLVSLALGILATKVSTALVAAVLAVVLSFAVRVVLWHRGAARAIAVGALLGGATISTVFVANNQALFLGLIQRDPTLTGRAVIWGAAAHEIAADPLLGYGWGAVWGIDGPVQRYVDLSAGFAASSSHSSYLDFLLEVGVVGLTLFILVLIALLRAAVIETLLTGSWDACIWAITTVFVLLVYSYAEPIALTPLALLVLITSVAASTSSKRKRELALYETSICNTRRHAPA